MEIIVQEVKVTRNYQITIPKAIAEKVGLRIGDRVLVSYENNEIKIIPKKVNLLEAIKEMKPKLGKEIKDADKEIREIIDKIVKKLE